MAHRPEDSQPLRAAPEALTVRLVDVEPFAGLCAAVGRFCVALTDEAIKAMTPDAIEALSTVQGIMWRLEHSNVERDQ